MVASEDYRAAMARMGAAVSVITTAGAAGRRGFTASAVCSVTDSPPTLLVCCNRNNDSHMALVGNGVLCVNTLSAGQAEISDIFAGAAEGEARFGIGNWDVLSTGAPVLHGAVVSFDCRIVKFTDIGTHTVFFATVESVIHGASRDALMYFARTYHPLLHPGG